MSISIWTSRLSTLLALSCILSIWSNSLSLLVKFYFTYSFFYNSFELESEWKPRNCFKLLVSLSESALLMLRGLSHSISKWRFLGRLRDLNCLSIVWLFNWSFVLLILLFFICPNTISAFMCLGTLICPKLLNGKSPIRCCSSSLNKFKCFLAYLSKWASWYSLTYLPSCSARSICYWTRVL